MCKRIVIVTFIKYNILIFVTYYTNALHNNIHWYEHYEHDIKTIV